MMKKFCAFLSVLLCIPAFASGGYIAPEYDDDDMLLYIDETGIDWGKFSSGYYELDGGIKSHAFGLNPGDWHVFYKEETEILGTSTCNKYTESQNFMSAADIDGQHCWCKIIAATNDIKKTAPVKWVYRGEFQDDDDCANLCTYRCAYNFLGDPNFRGEMLNFRKKQ